jgi:[protein-PII] uridylyltransferase
MNQKHTVPLLFFDEKRFIADLDKGRAIEVFRDVMNAVNQHFNNRFTEGEQIRTLVTERAAFIDRMLLHAWNQFPWDKKIALIAVGGYGRLELHPYSDIDLLILSKRSNQQRYKQSISNFLTFLWDIGLHVGQSVRSVEQCVTMAKADITVATNLLESRLLVGEEKLYRNMQSRTGPGRIWSSNSFFEAKRLEQNQRHEKHDNSEYNLEPDIKEAPGGLRDIQMIRWIAKRHYGVTQLADLVGSDFLSEEEYQLIRQGEEFLWRVRYGLHLIAKRAEEHLLFDHQRKLAEMFGYKDNDQRLAVEQFMQRYYRVVLAMHEQNDVLLHYLDEVILSDDQTTAVRFINERFQVREKLIEAISETLFEEQSSALLEIFVLLGEDSAIEGVRSKTIRQIRANRYRIDETYCADGYNRDLFMRLLRCPGKLSTQLQRMTRYGILGKYLPEFDRIIGQTQHDLFHVYPVDAHTILVVRNLRRLGNPELAQAFPVASHAYRNLPKPEILLIAGLYHDIAKGRGGDHSLLGSEDVEKFAINHGFTTQETRLMKWLVENHLIMSSVSQREDISDPDVIHKFALLVGNQLYLDHLIALTVADINATNSTLWNGWKASLIRQLYFATREALRRGLENPIDRQEWIDNARRDTLDGLFSIGVSQASALALWQDLDEDLFLRESPTVIARFTEKVLAFSTRTEPIVFIEDTGVEDANVTRIFIHTTGLDNVFAITAATLDRLRINIASAQLYTSDLHHHTFDIFYVFDEHGQAFADHDSLANRVQAELLNVLQSPSEKVFQIRRRTSRQLKQLSVATSAYIDGSATDSTSRLEVIAADRPGLLAQLGQIFMRFNLHLHSANIATLGERVEDLFYLTDASDLPLADPTFCREIETTICRELDDRNLS